MDVRGDEPGGQSALNHPFVRGVAALPWRWAIVVVVVAAIVSLCFTRYIAFGHDANRYCDVAAQIRSSGRIVTRMNFLAIENPSAGCGLHEFTFQPPGFPFVIAALGGSNPLDPFAVKLINICSYVLLAMAVFLLGRALGVLLSVAALMTMLAMLSYGVICILTQAGSDLLFCGLYYCVIYALVRSSHTKGAPALAWCLFAGLTAGACFFVELFHFCRWIAA
jgi:hypothetical protein